MKASFTYPARVEQDEGGFWLVTFPDFPEAATDDQDRDLALAEAADALAEAVAGRINRDEDIPAPSADVDARVQLPAQMQAKALLYRAVREAGISKSELARRMHADEKEARRLLDPHHPSKLPRLETALHAVGRKVELRVL